LSSSTRGTMEKLQRREESLAHQLAVLVHKYAEALEFYQQWRVGGITTRDELKAALRGKSEDEKIGELRRQIEMRTVGCGWHEFETKWGFFRDEKQQKIALLERMLLDDIIPHEIALRRRKQLPAEAAPPQTKARERRRLGTADADMLRLEAQSLFNVELLLEKAQVECERRERELVTDTHEYVQPPTAPPFDAELVGKRLEICWPYKQHGKTQKIWASGVVKRVADGITDKRPRARTKLLEAGALLWAWDADPEYDEKAGEEWLLLKPKHFNKPVEYGWRFDPCEMGSHSAPRAPQIERGTTEDEFLRD
jgi:hypothetical protein